MQKIRLFITGILIWLLWSCSGKTPIEIHLRNNTDLNLQDARVEIPLADLKQQLPDVNAEKLEIRYLNQVIPPQVITGEKSRLLFTVPLGAEEEIVLIVSETTDSEQSASFKKRTQAELSRKEGGYFENRKYIGGEFKNIDYIRVPDEHWDHSTYFRYEGPGWESDLVGYRFYLDWRNAIDIFGKKTTDMVLQNVGQDGFDSYHEMAEWGMDILKVGSSLGIGSIGHWDGDKVTMVSKTDSISCEVIANGSVYSQIRTSYFGWQSNASKNNLVSDISIWAGDRKSKHRIQIEPAIENICTGLVKHPQAKLLKSDAEGNWQYLANYGRQSLADDQLGMAILYDKRQLIALTEDEQSYVVVLKPQANLVTYYFLAAWEQEPDGIKSGAQFEEHLEDQITELDNPVSIRIK